ncbi:hypothetical protein ABGT18_13470 [Pseudomonas putida]|uniref:hypothetical protein n=1 Tax=Pseudomonas TaxID=286 RepID=UPI0003AF20A9|nr:MULTISPECIES: hypothetical protein [Pseudomonas]EKT4454559.1 hypothetical protein [Pseudomonas putida]EKT4470102.1 hypothetical protein [Pseudomonas putida]EKT4492347.1 hypothetical protein [Pseudomonas putida]EKT4511630.1 hypothetical protein [Pseudomonas putida]EKT8863628.1 hypothetical protein [Pseudomonas putida]
MDNLPRRFSYNEGGHLTCVDEIGYGANGEQPLRETLFERDAVGRLIAELNRGLFRDFEKQIAKDVLETGPAGQGPLRLSIMFLKRVI